METCADAVEPAASNMVSEMVGSSFLMLNAGCKGVATVAHLIDW
jgi:hypothetical protein